MRRAGPAFDEIASFTALCRAARTASAGLRDRPSVARFLGERETEVLALERELLEGSYEPLPLVTFRIHDPKPRTISVAAFRDRVVHHALCAGLEPVFERYADFDSYACRKGKGNLAALQRVQHHCRRHDWYVKLDIRHFFETVPHYRLIALLERLVRDRRVLGLARCIVEAGASEPGRGLPIGNLTSQHLGNLYLGRLDHHLREVVRVPAMVRYMDDVLAFAGERAGAHAIRVEAERFVEQELGQEVKHEATVVSPVRVGVPFLGLRTWPRLVRLDAARVRRFRRRVRFLHHAELPDDDLARRMGSLVAWTGQADTLRLRRSFFDRLAR